MSEWGEHGALAAPADALNGARAASADARSGAIAASADGTGGMLVATRDAPVGGQAVLEGVMMRGVSSWAVAVREPEGKIAVRSFPLVSWTRRHKVYRWPLIRGVVALAESLAIGMRALNISASAQLPEEDQELPRGTWVIATVVALCFAVGLFFVVPVGLTSLIKQPLGSSVAFWAVEGVLRTTIFIAYLYLLSRVRDLRRVFEYHGAEHKVISCYEASDQLVPERATLYSRLHPRCGTSFLLVVMIVAIFVFAPIGLPAWWVLVLTRIFGLPVIAGLSFELIKWAGRNRRRRWVQAIMYPGMQLQRLTTREPDLDQLAVAISALESVLAVDGAAPRSAEELVGLEVVA